MRRTDRRVALVLAIVLWVTFWSGSAHAAYQFYTTIDGTKQGKFKGEGAGRDTGRIPCLQFSYQPKPKPPRDVAPGQLSGKRQAWGNDTFDKEL